VLAGGAIYGVSLVLVPLIASPTGLYSTLGLLVGIALSCTTFVVVLGAVAQVVAPEKRSTAFGIITAGASLGIFIIVPGAQLLLSNFGWQTSFVLLAALVGSIIFLAFGLPNTPGNQRVSSSNPGHEEPLARVLGKASRHSGYWLLTGGFFVCGFHVAFIATHLPAFLSDFGVAPMAGATALAMIGLANVFGSYFFGYMGDRYRKKFLLSILYCSRAIVIGLFLLLPITNVSAIIFSIAIGFLWLATVPLTSGMVAQIFGSRYLATLYGIVFFSHQIGAFLGVWLGGRLYDTTGSYNTVWIIAIALGVVAALLHLPISDGSLQVHPSPHFSESTQALGGFLGKASK
jgi:predicted MFS family arabinose efflux permease